MPRDGTALVAVLTAPDHRAAMLRVVNAKIEQAIRRHDESSSKEPWVRVLDALYRWRARLDPRYVVRDGEKVARR